MKKSINNKIKALQNSAESQSEFMKKLAEVDENGQLTPALQEQINGGTGISKIGPVKPIIDLPVLSIYTPQPFPEMMTNLS